MSVISITRPQMVDWMATEGGASLAERPSCNWRRVNTIVADQASADFTAKLEGFHLFESIHSGHHRLRVISDLEQSARYFGDLRPGSVSYQQANVEADLECEGSAKIHQTFVDHDVFRETIQSTMKGDPDRVETLGFHGVFEPKLKILADALLEEARAPSAGGELYADLIAQQMAILILRRRHDAAMKAPVLTILSDAKLGLIADHIEADLAETGGLDTLATLVEMDVFALTRAFKAKTGQTLHQYLIERRLVRIKDLLLHGQDTLADIAYATGFASQSHMTMTFSKHVGMPPGAYRKAMQE